MENQAGAKVKRIRADGAGELTTSAFITAFYAEKRLHVEPTAPYFPQQNGIAERLNRVLVERIRAMLYGSGLDQALWDEALLAVVFTRNRSPTVDGRSTPHELFYGKTPDFSCLRLWGSPA